MVYTTHRLITLSAFGLDAYNPGCLLPHGCCRYDASANGVLQHPPQRQPSAAAAVQDALHHASGPLTRYSPQPLGQDLGSLDTLRAALMAPQAATPWQQQQGPAAPAAAPAVAESTLGMPGLGGAQAQAALSLSAAAAAGALGGGAGGMMLGAPGALPGLLVGGSSTDALAAYIDDSFQRARDFVQRQENQLEDAWSHSLQVGGGGTRVTGTGGGGGALVCRGWRMPGPIPCRWGGDWR
jgi:hypothetical protein